MAVHCGELRGQQSVDVVGCGGEGKLFGGGEEFEGVRVEPLDGGAAAGMVRFGGEGVGTCGGIGYMRIRRQPVRLRDTALPQRIWRRS